MKLNLFAHLARAILLFAILCLSLIALFAQTTAFTYQGRFADSTVPQPTNGTYDFQLALFDLASGGTQQGTLQTVAGVQVANGTFTVQLDFGTTAFPGADRFLEISVKKPADASYTPLAPRQQLTSSPYAVQTINAAQLGGVAANQYVQTNDSRLSDARPASSVDFGTATLSGTLPVARGGTGLSSSGSGGNFLKSNGSVWTSVPLSSSDIPAGSGNYIRNTTTQQSADFNVSGSGTVGSAFTASTVTSNSTSNLVFTGQSSSNIGSWLRLNNTSTGGHNWNIISTGSGNGEGAGKLLFNDQTSGGTRMQLDSTGAAFAGNSTFNGNLTVTGTLNATVTTSNFATLPHCKARQTTAQTFSSGTTINVRFDGTQFCSGVTFDNAADRLLIVTPGLYQITAEILFLTNGNGFRYMEINASNGGEVAAASINAVSNFSTQMNAVGMVRLNAGDVVALAAAQTSGGNLDTEIFNGRSASLTINWVGP